MHTIEVIAEPHNHGFPWRATCSCGWIAPRPYAARHAAELMGAEHVWTSPS